MELPKAFDPSKYEQEIYQKWEQSGFFAPQKKGKPFCIIMPPPNANGALHIGHAVFVTLEDLMIRYHRMRGESTLWLPGLDHAGFETQVVYQKKLEKEGRNWFQIPRAQLYQELLDFTLANKQHVEGQLRRLGASCDWSREIFTLDERIIKIVYQTFKKLYDDGLLYRGERIVSWCVKHQTTLSDLEVKHEDRDGRLTYIKYPLKKNPKSKILNPKQIQNPKSKIQNYIVVATTRPETMLGDTAVAVNPKDKRYKHLVGQIVILPLVGREIPIIADAVVEMEFGTGAVKVTPAHDPLDFEIAERHGLAKIQVIGQDGKMTDQSPEKYRGLKVEEARAKVVEDLRARGLIEKEEPYKHAVGICYKCNRTVEPLVMPQWFVKMEPLAKKAMSAVKKGKVKFVTKRFEKIFFHWLKNIRDWNISRQIVWGIRIPVWYCPNSELHIKKLPLKMGFAGDIVAQVFDKKTRTYRTRNHDFKIGDEVAFENSLTGEIFGFGTIIEVKETIVGEIDLQDKKHWKTYNKREELIAAFKRHHPEIEVKNSTPVWVYTYKFQPVCGPVISNGIAPEKCPHCGSTELEQESDVLDTWFSSGQWPFATLLIKGSSDFKRFYPTSVMETAHDILFFWVARMIMMGLYATSQVPFKYVYLHGLVRDKDRQKMSKSKGNVIDPLGVIDLYGTDALRMALVFGVSAGNDIVISEDKIRAHRNFANKIWNASRFVLLNLGNNFKPLEIKKIKKTDLSDRSDQKILKDLDIVTKKITKYLDKFEFHLAAEEIYQFFWHEFCDKYLEQVKGRLVENVALEDKKVAQAVLYKILLDSLKMLHPFMPFVTEAVYQMLPAKKKEFLMIEAWPFSKS